MSLPPSSSLPSPSPFSATTLPEPLPVPAVVSGRVALPAPLPSGGIVLSGGFFAFASRLFAHSSMSAMKCSVSARFSADSGLAVILILQRQVALVEERGVLALAALPVRLRDVVEVRRLLALDGLDREALLERVGGLVEVAEVVLGLAFLVPVVGGLRLRQCQHRHQQRRAYQRSHPHPFAFQSIRVSRDSRRSRAFERAALAAAVARTGVPTGRRRRDLDELRRRRDLVVGVEGDVVDHAVRVAVELEHDLGPGLGVRDQQRRVRLLAGVDAVEEDLGARRATTRSSA